jgi:glycosyltransferase involved in cell wall biosynthesis
MEKPPRLTIGLPVYNGEKYLAAALDSLLTQSFADFRLIISDNASSDLTSDICQHYLKRDPRVRYVRQPHNIGCAANHRFVFEQSRSKLFKWASCDDLYHHDLLLRCIDVLDEHPEAILAHSWTGLVTVDNAHSARALKYSLATNSTHTPERFRSILFDSGGDDDYGVTRADVLRRTPLHNSYHRADRTLVAELALLGPFHHVPDWLYYRRDHPNSSRRATVRDRCVNFDPRRADKLRHPVPRLLLEYIYGYVAAIRRVPMSARDRRLCFAHLIKWLTNRALHSKFVVGNPKFNEVEDYGFIAIDLDRVPTAASGSRQ